MPPSSARFPKGRFVDPSFLAESQATTRGLRDLLKDTKRSKRFLKQDVRTQIGDIRLEKTRGIQDIQRGRRRGLQDIGFQRFDVKRESERGMEDFSTRLTNLIGDFQTLSRTQEQAALASGVSGGSAGAAAAAARAANLARARQPIDVGRERLAEDTSTQLGRLDVSQNRLMSDAAREALRLRQDTRHDIGLAQRERKRGLGDIRLERKRGRRESIFTKRDLSRQARFGARLTRLSLNPYTQ